MTPREQFQAILGEVAFDHMVGEREILGTGKTKEVSRARQAFYLRLLEAGRTCSEIARLLNRDHTTVLYGIRRAREGWAR